MSSILIYFPFGTYNNQNLISRFEKKGISKRFFPDTRDESYSAEGVCDRTPSGEVLQHCMLFIELLF